MFLINKSTPIYKQLFNLAEQQDPPKEVQQLNIHEIVQFMRDQFDAKHVVVRERFKFWTGTKRRKPGETIQVLAARIKENGATCDFSSIRNPLDEAMRTCFICSINNEAFLKLCLRSRKVS